jgi:hypothetical protein
MSNKEPFATAIDLSTEAICCTCHWKGTLGQLVFKTSYSLYNESPEPCCPACKSINIIIKE